MSGAPLSAEPSSYAMHKDPCEDATPPDAKKIMGGGHAKGSARPFGWRALKLEVSSVQHSASAALLAADSTIAQGFPVHDSPGGASRAQAQSPSEVVRLASEALATPSPGLFRKKKPALALPPMGQPCYPSGSAVAAVRGLALDSDAMRAKPPRGPAPADASPRGARLSSPPNCNSAPPTLTTQCALRSPHAPEPASVLPPAERHRQVRGEANGTAAAEAAAPEEPPPPKPAAPGEASASTRVAVGAASAAATTTARPAELAEVATEFWAGIGALFR